MNGNDTWMPLLGRVGLGLIFLLSGFGKITGFEGTAKYIAAGGLPLPAVAAALAIAVEVVGGAALIAGIKARWAALALIAFTAVATFVFHAFWAVPEAQAYLQQIMFLKNVAIIGGLLFVVAQGPGKLSLDQRMAAAAA